MAVFTHIETDSAANANISSATAIGVYTATADKLVMCDVSIDAVAGNGDYVMYVTRQIGGSGSAYVILPKTTMAAASGETAISGQSGWITVRNADVLTVYVDGLAGDTETPDWTTRWFELAGVTAAGVADAVWDEATADHTTGTTFGGLDVNVDAILADTGTDGVKISAGSGAGQLDFTSGVVKANLAQILGTVLTETAGLIAAGFKKFFNVATPTGTVNSLPGAVPGANGGLPTTDGTKVAQTVDLTAGQSIAANGGTVATVTTVTNAPTDMAKESTLMAIKGASWADETLVTIQAAAEGATAPSAADVADAVWNEAIADHATTGSTGKTLAAAGSAGDPWSTALPGAYGAGTAGNIVPAIKAKTDLITTGTTLTIASAVSGSTITAHRGDTLSAALENIGALTNYSKLWFTVKRDYDYADSAAVIQIEKTGGLLYLNGAVGTAGNGSLTINDEATGDVTIVLAAVEVAKLNPGNYQYDIQILRSAGTPVSTLTYGEFVVPADVTRATS